jgi:hypothetical protein
MSVGSDHRREEEERFRLRSRAAIAALIDVHPEQRTYRHQVHRREFNTRI